MSATTVAYYGPLARGGPPDGMVPGPEYYSADGRTRLVWGGGSAASLGLSGPATDDDYWAVFGPGGCRDPETGHRLTATRRPGFLLAMGPDKSVAVLGVIGRWDDMHSIITAETEAAMAWLDDWFRVRGGRRGKRSVPQPTAGLTYAVSRRAVSTAGDPSPEDHVLVANVAEMRDSTGGFKALASRVLRDLAEPATMVGRLAAAAKAIELGYTIEPDGGRTGRKRGLRIAGVPRSVGELFSTRAREIDERLLQMGHDTYRARHAAARATRHRKPQPAVRVLLPRWRQQLESIDWPVTRLRESITAASKRSSGLLPPMDDELMEQLATVVFASDGPLLARSKEFTRSRLIAEVAPLMYGNDPAELDLVIDQLLASSYVTRLPDRPGAHEPQYTGW